MRLGPEDSEAIRAEQARPAADTPARRDLFARVDRLLGARTLTDVLLDVLYAVIYVVVISAIAYTLCVATHP